jgi:hypothetical protein
VRMPGRGDGSLDLELVWMMRTIGLVSLIATFELR